MQTTYIHTSAPLAIPHLALFAYYHRAATSNELSIITNRAGDECLVKLTSNVPIEHALPDGFVPLALYDDLNVVRELLQTPAWITL